MEHSNTGTNLPELLTRDGAPFGIGSLLYVVWYGSRKDTLGRWRRKTKPEIYHVDVTKIVFERNICDGTTEADYDAAEVYWSAEGYSSDGEYNVPDITMGKYNTFASKAAAEKSLESGEWDDGLWSYYGMPLVPKTRYDKMLEKYRYGGEV